MITSSLARDLQEAVKILRQNGVIAFPTDTLYGLGVDPFSLEAVGRVFEIKGRSTTKPLPLLLARAQDMDPLVHHIPALAYTLTEAFWPGSLTLVLPASSRVPREVTGGRGTVAVRVPNHPIAQGLALELGGPITGTSANVSGGADPVTAQDVRRMLDDRVDYILDGGPAPVGCPSTVVDLTGPRPRIVRTGALSREAIERVGGVPFESS